MTLHPGDVFFIPLGETYRSQWGEEEDMACQSVFFDFAPEGDPLSGYRWALQKLPDCADSEPLFSALREGRETPDKNSVLALGAAFYALCAALFPILTALCPVSRTSVGPAVAYITEHYNQPVSASFLASLCALSESRFYHRFQEEMGVSPITFRNRVAINHALRLLQTRPELTIETISSLCGFCSSSYFRRIFRHELGSTPRECRAPATV